MLGRLKLLAPFIAALSVAGCNAGGLSVPVMTGQSASQVHPIPQWQAQNLAHRACPEVLSGEVQCQLDRKSTRLNSSHEVPSRMPSSA